MRRLILTLLMMVGLSGGALAQEPPPTPDQPLARPEQEARAQALFNEIRCVVCQHESIADSPAGVASDMRRWVRDRIAAGESDAEIREGLVARYGDYVLFTPPLRAGTLLLWGLPLVLVLGGGVVLVWIGRRRPVAEGPAELTESERLAVQDLLKAATSGPEDDATSPPKTQG
ncbi:cytochrome c-type biogenesis protein [Brevundimonas poindexterae]|uniref:cytochrome c-type biogenesis protein n=1 Tax=Brevundimonas poindexterae TaxID=74325 RepID=UPI001CFD917C|nr:cytochrome c-type biogenesis protein [Brevundimonas poindexterae]